MAGGAATYDFFTYDELPTADAVDDTDIKTHRVLVGAADRIKAERKYDVPAHQVRYSDHAEEWQTFAIFCAATRSKLTGGRDFDEWLETYLGPRSEESEVDAMRKAVADWANERSEVIGRDGMRELAVILAGEADEDADEDTESPGEQTPA